MAEGTGTRLLIARHAETRDNAAGRWQGWNDSPLSERGLAQAADLARRLAREPLAAVYCSDLGRAVHTARIAAAPHNLAPSATSALRERNVGLFSGLTGAEVEGRYAPVLARRGADSVLDWSSPEGESYRQVLARVLPALDGIAAAWPGEMALVVTHGGVVRLLASYALDRDWAHTYQRHPSNCGLSHLTLSSDGRLTLHHFDERDYLDREASPPLAEGTA